MVRRTKLSESIITRRIRREPHYTAASHHPQIDDGEPGDARTASGTARSQRAVPSGRPGRPRPDNRRMLRLGTIVLNVKDARRASQFWSQALGYAYRDSGYRDDTTPVLLPHQDSARARTGGGRPDAPRPPHRQRPGTAGRGRTPDIARGHPGRLGIPRRRPLRRPRRPRRQPLLRREHRPRITHTCTRDGRLAPNTRLRLDGRQATYLITPGFSSVLVGEFAH